MAGPNPAVDALVTVATVVNCSAWCRATDFLDRLISRHAPLGKARGAACIANMI